MQNYYNLGAKYEIIGRIPKGTSVVGYLLLDRKSNAKVKLDKQIVEQLALNKQIYNCFAQVYGDIVNLKGIHCKISEMPKYDTNCNKIREITDKRNASAQYKLLGRIMNGKEVMEYIMASLDKPDDIVRIEKAEVVKLAEYGRIENITCQNNNGKVMLRSLGKTDELSKLKSIQSYEIPGGKLTWPIVIK